MEALDCAPGDGSYLTIIDHPDEALQLHDGSHGLRPVLAIDRAGIDAIHYGKDLDDACRGGVGVRPYEGWHGVGIEVADGITGGLNHGIREEGHRPGRGSG